MPRPEKADIELAKTFLRDEQEKNSISLKAWALVELFGHQRIVGHVTVDPAEFPGMIRVDVPDLLKNGAVDRPGFTRYIGRAALYGVTPIDEATVRNMLPHVDGRPARPMELGRDRYSEDEL
jgi:hypothetical protein